jgi:uncharacterized protein YdeI (YjbR/CyaY-like superfamily)
MTTAEPEIKAFKNAQKWRDWLKRNHSKSDGLWLQIFKKDSGEATVTYKEALDEALCFGWIDGQKKSLDAASFLQRFTPRRSRSIWSKINIGHTKRLIAEGRMEKAGQAQIDAAKEDGRWARAYDAPSTSETPADFLKELRKSKPAAAFFKTLNRANLYAINWRLQTAKKPETRAKRITDIVAMLARGEKFH